MNGTMGRYVDGLDDEGRDRLVQAGEFNDGYHWWEDECGCLVGTVERETAHCGLQSSIADNAPMHGTRFCNDCDVEWHDAPAAIRYLYAVARFGKDRVVRAIKLRAGAKVDLGEVVAEREVAEVVS